MEHEIRNDLTIVGTSNGTGGLYRKVSIIGEGSMDGDVDCTDLKCTGTCEIEGDLKAKSVSVIGTVQISGNLGSAKLKTEGQIDVRGNATLKDMKLGGEMSVKGNLVSESIVGSGFLKVGGKCDAEVFEVKGAFTIGELLNAGTIDITLYGGCKAGEIGGENISVKKGASIQHFIQRLFVNDENVSRLQTEIVEGNEIYLEYTKAKIVRGNNVTIGPGCKIERVEYQGLFEQHHKSEVRESTQI